MDDGLYIGSYAVDGEMHAYLAGYVACSCELMTVVVDNDHVGGTKETFAASCGCGEDEVFVEPNGEVARGARSVAEAMDPTTETNKLFAEVHFRGMERRFEVGGFEVDRLLRHELSHWIVALLFFWGFDSFLTFRPTTSEILKR